MSTTVKENSLSLIDKKITDQIKKAEKTLKYLKNQLKDPNARVGVKLEDPEFIYMRTWSEIDVEMIDQGEEYPFIQTCQDLIEYVAAAGGTFEVNSATPVRDGVINPEDDISYEEGNPDALEFWYFFDTKMDGDDSKDKYVSIDWFFSVPKSNYEGLMDLLSNIDNCGSAKLF